MKKIYFIIASLLTASCFNAQTLTQANHAPNVGDTYQMYQCDSTGINAGASGASAVWNFAGVNARLNLLKTYNSAAVTSATYPNATVAVGSSTANTSYYNSDASSLKYYGGNISVGSIAVTLVYTNAAVQASYPMSLNTTTNNTIGGSITALSLPGTFTGNASVKADGTGTLILPGTNATFTNAIRVVSSQTINFSGIASGIVTQTNYDYYVTGIKAPAFSINVSTMNVTSPLPSVTTQTLVFRNKNAVLTATTDVGIRTNLLSDEQVVLFPNPCNNIINFKMPLLNNAHLQVLDLTGKTIETIEISADKLSLNTINYNNGLYFYRIQNNHGETLKTGKFTVSH